MSAVIRDLLPDDLDRVHAINQANVPEVGTLRREQLDDLLEESAFALVVEDGGELVGFCVLIAPGSPYRSVNYRWFMDRYDDAMYLDRVAFDADHRGRGLGTRLYAEVERRIVHEHPDLARLTLEVNLDPPNEPSMAFHARRGFVEVGRQVTDYGAEVCLMQKLLER